MIRPTALARWIGVSPAAIRQWVSGEFGRYLSPSGAGGEGQWRAFTEQDARILAHLWALKQKGVKRQVIHEQLQQMQADGWVDLPEMPPAPAGVEPDRLIPERAVERVVDTQRAAANNQIAMLESRIDELKAELEAERQRRETDLAAERQRREDETKDLLRQLVEAQTELRLLREGRLKPGD